MRIQTHVKTAGMLVSTTRLPFDHGWDGVPKWYETMVFSANEDGKVTNWSEHYCERYTTEDEAQYGHERVVAMVEVAEIAARDTND